MELMFLMVFQWLVPMRMGKAACNCGWLESCGLACIGYNWLTKEGDKQVTAQWNGGALVVKILDLQWCWSFTYIFWSKQINQMIHTMVFIKQSVFFSSNTTGGCARCSGFYAAFCGCFCYTRTTAMTVRTSYSDPNTNSTEDDSSLPPWDTALELDSVDASAPADAEPEPNVGVGSLITLNLALRQSFDFTWRSCWCLAWSSTAGLLHHNIRDGSSRKHSIFAKCPSICIHVTFFLAFLSALHAFV